MNVKKGQVTLFVILGLVILIIVGVAIFLLSLKKDQVPEDFFEQNYDARLAPIYNDVAYCLKSLTKEAIIKIGSTGGYIDVVPQMYSYNLPKSYENDALELFPDSEIVVPYWLHIEGNPDSVSNEQTIDIPALSGQGNSIQNQIETYVEQNIVTCVDNFSAYKSDLEIDYKDMPSSFVEIRDENVYSRVDWTLDVEFPDGTKSNSLKNYSAVTDVRLKKMYEYAVAILYQTEMLDETRAFESFTKDIISFYSFGEDGMIPPVSGPTVFEFKAPKMWLLRNVESTLKNAVSENIPYMQVEGTKESFMLFSNNSVSATLYSNFQNTVFYDDEFASDVRVRFNYYDMWPMYVHVSPGGQVIMPESSVVKLLVMQITTTKYRFYYDISYPVLATLEDDEAFGGEGFTFNYPFEVNLRNNEPYSNESMSLSDIISFEESESLGISQRTVPIKISVIDGYTSLPLDDVTVSYKCIDEESIVGTSKSTSSNPNAMIDSYLAPCIGGAFFVSSMGYSESVYYRDVNLDEPLMFDYTVYPAKEISLDVRKKMFEPTITPDVREVNENGSTILITDDTVDRKWTLSSPNSPGISTLLSDEEYVIMINEEREFGGMGVSAIIPSDEPMKTVSLVPGKYTIDLIATVKMGDGYSRQNITIPKRKITVRGEDPVINETIIEKSIFTGMLSMNEETGYFEVYSGPLATKSYLTLYYPSYDVDKLRFVEDLDVLGKVQSAPKDYPEAFRPLME